MDWRDFYFEGKTVPDRLRKFKKWVSVFSWRKAKSESDFWFRSPYRERSAHFDDPATWDKFWNAVNYINYRKGWNPQCVAFVLAKDDPFTVIQLDGSRVMTTGKIKPWAIGIIERLQSYTEVMPLGRGIRIIVEGQLPGPSRRRGGIEVYDHGRYLPIMGNTLDGYPDDVMNRQEELEGLYRDLFGLAGEGYSKEIKCGFHPTKRLFTMAHKIWFKIDLKMDSKYRPIADMLDGHIPIPSGKVEKYFETFSVKF